MQLLVLDIGICTYVYQLVWEAIVFHVNNTIHNDIICADYKAYVRGAVKVHSLVVIYFFMTYDMKYFVSWHSPKTTCVGACFICNFIKFL